MLLRHHANMAEICVRVYPPANQWPVLSYCHRTTILALYCTQGEGRREEGGSVVDSWRGKRRKFPLTICIYTGNASHNDKNTAHTDKDTLYTD